MRILYLEAEEKGPCPRLLSQEPGWAGIKASRWLFSLTAVLENDAKIRKLRQEAEMMEMKMFLQCLPTHT